jgi:hypothetical protein
MKTMINLLEVERLEEICASSASLAWTDDGWRLRPYSALHDQLDSRHLPGDDDAQSAQPLSPFGSTGQGCSA